MNIIRQDASGMRIYRSEKEFPKKKCFGYNFVWQVAVEEWFKRAESIPVCVGEAEKFKLHIINEGLLTHPFKEFSEMLSEGIPIPDDCFYKGQDGYAYFKEPGERYPETAYEPILFGMFLTGRDRESVERDFELWKLKPQESGE